MPETNPYQAPQASLTSAAVPVKLRELVPWNEEGRHVLHAMAKQHRWMVCAYYAFLLYGGCCSVSGYLGSRYLSKQAGDLLAFQVLPLPFLYFALMFHVYQLAKFLNNSWTPLISLLMMILLPYSLAVPIFYHRRAVHCFARYGIPLGLWGIGPVQLDTQIDAAYDAFQRNSAST